VIQSCCVEDEINSEFFAWNCMLNFTNMGSHAVDSGCTKMIYKNCTGNTS